MKKALILLIISLISIETWSQNPMIFNIQKIEVKLDNPIKSVEVIKSDIYCLTFDNKLIILDSVSNTKDTLRVLLNFKTLFEKNDTLFALTYGDSIYSYSNNSFNYILKQKNSNSFYEDNQFVVLTECMGEFGGWVYFYNKRNKKIYYADATCPIVINKLNNSYFVTSSLNHFFGLSKVIEIDNPRKLRKKPSKKIRLGELYSTSDLKHPTKGTHTIIDTVGAIITNSFVYNNKLYHILVNTNGTNLCIINNKKLESIVKLSDSNILMTSSYNNFNIGPSVGFNNLYANGFIYLKGNKIVVITYKR
jgi:hypothetical protein